MLAETGVELEVDDVATGDDACALRGMIRIQQLLLFQVKLGSCRSNLNLGSNWVSSGGKGQVRAELLRRHLPQWLVFFLPSSKFQEQFAPPQGKCRQFDPKCHSKIQIWFSPRSINQWGQCMQPTILVAQSWTMRVESQSNQSEAITICFSIWFILYETIPFVWFHLRGVLSNCGVDCREWQSRFGSNPVSN